MGTEFFVVAGALIHFRLSVTLPQPLVFPPTVQNSMKNQDMSNTITQPHSSWQESAQDSQQSSLSTRDSLQRPPLQQAPPMPPRAARNRVYPTSGGGSKFLEGLMVCCLAASTALTMAVGLPAVGWAQDQEEDTKQQGTPLIPVIEAPVRQVLTPMLKNLTAANKLRATVRMTVTSAVGDEVLGQNQGLFQLASERPNQFALSAKFDTEAVQFVCDGNNLFVRLSAEDYLELPAPTVFEELITAMPIQLGPQPEPMLWISLAGVNPVEPLFVGLKTCKVVEPTVPVESDESTSTVRAVRPEGLVWELTVTKGQAGRPVRLLIDMTEMIKQTNNLQVPEGYSFKIQYDFEKWETDAELPRGIFDFTRPEKAKKFNSLADYLLRDGAMANHPLLGKPAPTFTARLYEGEEVTFEHDPDGKVVVLDFWATWCGPCVEALPEVQNLAKKFEGKDVIFYAVNVSETPEAIGEFLKTHELDLPVLVDPEGQLSAAFRATAIPQTVLIGKGGRVEAVHVGFDPGESMSILEKEIETLLEGRRIYQAKEEEVADDELEDAEQSEQKKNGENESQSDSAGSKDGNK